MDGLIAGEMIRDDIYRFNSMVEKPKPENAPSNLAIIGRYILPPGYLRPDRRY